MFLAGAATGTGGWRRLTAGNLVEVRLPSRSVARFLRWCIPVLAAALAALLAASPGNAASGAPSLDLERYRGRVVVVDFWASWCKPCRQSIPWLNELQARYGARGLVILGVNVDAQREDAERFLRETPIGFEIVFDPRGELARRFALQGMPSSLIFDRSGTLVATHVGFQQSRQAAKEADLRQLLDQVRP
jgi:thiol-disulfide isomerase/thioredoxin